MKTIKLLVTFLMLIIIHLNGLTQDYSTINIYYKNKLGSLNETITFNNTPIATMSLGSRLQCTMYSEGTLLIKSMNQYNGQDMIRLEIKKGNTYYIEMTAKGFGSSWTGKLEVVDKVKGEMEFNKNKNWPLNYFEEDLYALIIRPKNPTYQNQVTNPQIIYVETNQNAKYEYLPVSDIDKNIPETNSINEMSFALIIGNEDYATFQTDLSKEMNVEFARNDASAFKYYAIKTLGIPEKNITFLLDATYGQISQSLSKMNLIAKSTNGKATIYFYYAGHGLPDQNTKEPYLMPVDVSGSNLSAAIKLKDVYSKLTEYPSERIIVFLDACFTGGGRDQGLLSARAVKVRPREDLLTGNITVIASSSEDQTSLPYKDKKHGLFTYYLLKKIQETKGDITLKELSEFLNEKVNLESILINNKEQTPKTNISLEVETTWQNWKLK